VGFFTHRFELGITIRPQAEVAFSEDAVRVAEGSTHTLTLRRSGPAQLGAGTVTVTSLPASATSGSDFSPISTSVFFDPDEREKTIDVEALADDEREPDETFLVAVGSPSGDAETGAPASVAVTIPAPATSGSGGTPPAFGAKTLVSLALATRRTPANGPVKVRVTNANAFAVSGRLSAKAAGKRRLRSKPFTVRAHAKMTIGLRLPSALRRLLRHKHRLPLRLAATVKDPAGHARKLTKVVKPILRNRGT
jgi:hypothetical protein